MKKPDTKNTPDIAPTEDMEALRAQMFNMQWKSIF
jgi:hypothetical protein